MTENIQKYDLTILCDYSWMAHRFAHVHKYLRVIIEGQDIPTGAVYGFTNFVSSVYKRYQNKKIEIIFCKDVTSTERSDEFADYKGHRNTNKEIFIDDFNISSVLCLMKNISFAYAKNKEADDVLALLAYQKSKNNPVIVYTGDNDLLQITSENIYISREFGKDQLIPITEQYIQDKFGVTSFDKLTKVRSILGDTSDNIPSIGHGLRKIFLSMFVDKWIELGYDKAINRDLYPTKIKGVSNQNIDEHLVLLKDNKELVFKNYSLINLIKYAEVENTFDIEHYRVKSNPILIEAYQLNDFKNFLNYFAVIDNQ